MENIFNQIVENIATERAQWLDKVIREAIPQWKINLLLKYNNRLLRKLLRIDLEILIQDLISDFATQYIVILNGKIIAKRKFSVELNEKNPRGVFTI